MFESIEKNVKSNNKNNYTKKILKLCNSCGKWTFFSYYNGLPNYACMTQ